jgi:hypothetical protein
MMKNSRYARLCLALCAAFIMSTPALAQDAAKDPMMPAPLETMAKEGAQVRYLGR